MLIKQGNKLYVDSIAQGLDTKQNATLASARTHSGATSVSTFLIDNTSSLIADSFYAFSDGNTYDATAGAEHTEVDFTHHSSTNSAGTVKVTYDDANGTLTCNENLVLVLDGYAITGTSVKNTTNPDGSVTSTTIATKMRKIVFVNNTGAAINWTNANGVMESIDPGHLVMSQEIDIDLNSSQSANPGMQLSGIRILVKNEDSAKTDSDVASNGIYYVSQIGSNGQNTISEEGCRWNYY